MVHTHIDRTDSRVDSILTTIIVKYDGTNFIGAQMAFPFGKTTQWSEQEALSLLHSVYKAVAAGDETGGGLIRPNHLQPVDVKVGEQK